MSDKLSFQSLQPHLKNLRASGCFPLSPETPRFKRFIHTIYMRLALFFILLFTVQETIKMIQVRNDAAKVMDTLFLLLTNSDCIYKQLVLWKKAGKIEQLLDVMKGRIFNPAAPHHQSSLARTVRQARVFLKGFNGFALATCVLFLLYLLILSAQGNPVEFAIWLPFDVNNKPQYHCVLAYVSILNAWIAFNNTTMDAFISFFLAQSKTQLFILRMDLETVVASSKKEALVLSRSWQKVYREHFKAILRHYREVIKFSRNIQDIFGGALLYQFLVTGWIICAAAYRTVNMKPASIEFISMLMYIICILTEILLYCFIGNELHYESGLLMQSIYSLEWLETPLEHRKDLIVFMERVKRPITPMAGTFFPLSISTFISILRSSYSFYAFLKNSG